METPSEYLEKTDSAIRHLFWGISTYLERLKIVVNPLQVSVEVWGPAQNAEYEHWHMENAEAIEAARRAEEDFIAESFALGTLAGAVLQVAEKALELYGKGIEIPEEWRSVKSVKARFCCGRLVRGVPLGLIVHAARNQHAHYADKALREPNRTVFERLATEHGNPTDARDPAFDLSNPALSTFATNVTGLIKWRTHEQYLHDMRDMLGV